MSRISYKTERVRYVHPNPTSFRPSFINKNRSWAKCPLINFKGSNRLLFLVILLVLIYKWDCITAVILMSLNAVSNSLVLVWEWGVPSNWISTLFIFITSVNLREHSLRKDFWLVWFPRCITHVKNFDENKNPLDCLLIENRLKWSCLILIGILVLCLTIGFNSF